MPGARPVDISALRKSVLVFGSGGALGSAVAHTFASAHWRVIGCCSGWSGPPLQIELQSTTGTGRHPSASTSREAVTDDARSTGVARGRTLASRGGEQIQAGKAREEKTFGIAENGPTAGGGGGSSLKWPRLEKWHRSARGWRATAAPPHAVADIATQSFERAFSLQKQGEDLLEQLQPLLAAGPPLGAAICCSGAFDMTPPGSPFFLDEAQRLIKANCWPALLCAHTAVVLQQRHQSPLLLVLTGAAGIAQSESSPSMIAYGCAKTYVHHLVRSLAAASLTANASSTPDSTKAAADIPKPHERHLQAGSGCAKELDDRNGTVPRPSLRVIGLLPTTLDTPANRVSMQHISEDVRDNTWTDVRDVAEQMLRWSENPEEVTNGQLYVVSTDKKKTKFLLV